MLDVNWLGTPERQAHAVQRDRIVRSDRLKRSDRGASSHVVLGVNLEPRDIRRRLGDEPMVRETQPDAGASSNSAAVRTCDCGANQVYPPPSGVCRAALDLLAGTF